jgi:catechol 2,3-dioxygenase-like lactoylglutathione lyase family enzyme
MFTVRYMVTDVDESIKFYTAHFGFTLDQSMAPAFAKVSKGDLVLWLSGPQSSAARPMPNGDVPHPGGWNRFVIQVENIAETVAELKKTSVTFRNEIVTGPGGKQIVIEDPSGNPVELFEPAKVE